MPTSCRGIARWPSVARSVTLPFWCRKCRALAYACAAWPTVVAGRPSPTQRRRRPTRVAGSLRGQAQRPQPHRVQGEVPLRRGTRTARQMEAIGGSTPATRSGCTELPLATTIACYHANAWMNRSPPNWPIPRNLTLLQPRLRRQTTTRRKGRVSRSEQRPGAMP